MVLFPKLLFQVRSGNEYRLYADLKAINQISEDKKKKKQPYFFLLFHLITNSSDFFPEAK